MAIEPKSRQLFRHKNQMLLFLHPSEDLLLILGAFQNRLELDILNNRIIRWIEDDNANFKSARWTGSDGACLLR